MRVLFRSFSNTTLFARAAEYVAAAKDGALIIAPTRSAADDFVRASLKAGQAGLHRMTLSHLAAQLSANAVAEQCLSPIGTLGLEALAARVAYTLRQELRYFSPVVGMPGFARALAATLSELRFQQIDSVKLRESGAPGADLALALAAYEEELRVGALADGASLVELAVNAVIPVGLPLLLLDVPVRTALHAKLIAALAARASSTLAVVQSGDAESIAALSLCLGVESEGSLDEEPSALGRVRRFLFSAEVPRANETDPSLELFSAPGEGLECVEIARRIRTLCTQGTAFDQIAVLLRAPERYQPLMEEALRRAGIPGYFSRGTVRPDSGGRAFLALLACASEGCSASRFAEYLSLAQVPDLDIAGAPIRSDATATAEDELLAGFEGTAPEARVEEAAPSLSVPSNWERLLVDAAVVGGVDRWTRRLRGLEAELRKQLDDADDSTEHLERRLDQLKALEHFALPVIEQLGALPAEAAWAEWIEKLTVLAQTAIRYPESVLSALAELRPMGEVGPASRDEVYGVLSERLRFLRREPVLRRYGCVWVGSLDEARGRGFSAVFVPGLAEGVFPKRAMEDPLLLDEFREKLGGGLPTQDTRVARERLLLHAAAASAANRLVVSYSRMDVAQARPRVPSFYALEVVRAAEGRLPDLKEFGNRLASAAPAKLGWPAPIDPLSAVDDAEYDLAVLHRILSLPKAQVKGRGRYLVEANPILGRSLRTRYLRWEKKWSSADGLVNPDAAGLAALQASRLSERSYSPTALQQFSTCPYKFLLYSIHRLREREASVPLEQMDPLTRGSLFHQTQFDLFGTLQREGLLPVTPQTLQHVLDLADQSLDRTAAQYKEDLAPAIERVWATEVEDLRTDLRGWVRDVAALDIEWQPVRFEFGFGLAPDAGRDPSSQKDEVLLDGVRLRGSVDLVERNARRGVLRVTDHKTGKSPEIAPAYVGGGAVLQPVLYAMAVEQLMGETVESGRLLYCTQRGNYDRIEMRVTPAAKLHLKQVLLTIDESIEKGFLPAAPKAGACAFCDYQAVCGPYEQRRVRDKPSQNLLPLMGVRELP
jgi:CRISPR/Cas system-associated exonuclease Cas4 (RecB family)